MAQCLQADRHRISRIRLFSAENSHPVPFAGPVEETPPVVRSAYVSGNHLHNLIEILHLVLYSP